MAQIASLLIALPAPYTYHNISDKLPKSVTGTLTTNLNKKFAMLGLSQQWRGINKPQSKSVIH